MHIKTLQRLHSIIRVNQAGEKAAVRIYKAQNWALQKRGEFSYTIPTMQQQEERHLEYFNDKLLEYSVRPSIVDPIWAIAAYGMGALSGILGLKSAMTCTMAVEDVIEAHYAKQITTLENLIHQGHDKDGKLAAMIEAIRQFRNEEMEHRDIAAEKNHKKGALYKLFSAATKIGVMIAKRI